MTANANGIVGLRSLKGDDQRIPAIMRRAKRLIKQIGEQRLNEHLRRKLQLALTPHDELLLLVNTARHPAKPSYSLCK